MVTIVTLDIDVPERQAHAMAPRMDCGLNYFGVPVLHRGGGDDTTRPPRWRAGNEFRWKERVGQFNASIE